MSELLTAALKYAARGWPVLPLRPRDKVPLNPTGSKGASTDAAQIEAWWQAHPAANVGIATGGAAAPWVLDLDEGGEAAWALEHGSLPDDAPRVRTARGLHVYFAPDADVRNRQKVDGLPVDVRGVGGYVVAPPSVHASGHVYRWEVEGLPQPAPRYVRRACVAVAPPVPQAHVPVNLQASLEGLPRRRARRPAAGVRSALAQTLPAGLGGQSPAGVLQAIGALGQLSRDLDPQVRYAAIVGLGQVKSPKVLPFLRRGLRDSDGVVVKAASGAIDRFRSTAKAKPAKVKIAKKAAGKAKLA